jgi:hypothetical protein
MGIEGLGWCGPSVPPIIKRFAFVYLWAISELIWAW